MAIKVNGTTVIDNSRNFTNIAGGFKTVNGTSVVGSGDISAGASTTYNAVGTYVWARRATGVVIEGSTYAGSGLNPAGGLRFAFDSADDYGAFYITHGPGTLSGTWRAMSRQNAYSNQASYNLYVRIS